MNKQKRKFVIMYDTTYNTKEILDNLPENYTNINLIKLWNELSANGKFYQEFYTKQMLKYGTFTVGFTDWLKLLNNGSRLKRLEQHRPEEILHTWKLAKWLANNYEEMTFHRCQICNKVNFYIDDENHKYYYKFNLIKAKCHILETQKPVGYGSKLDTFNTKEDEKKIKITLCDDCLEQIIENKKEQNFININNYIYCI